MMSGLHPVNKDPQRCTRYYTFVDELNMDGVEYPVKLDGRVFKKIRDNNPGSPFNVFIYSTSGEKEEVLPFSLHSDPNVPNVVDLLYIGEESEGHYVWIKSFSRLLNGERKDGHRRFLCKKCFQNFTTEEFLLRHIPDCNTSVEGIKVFPRCFSCEEYDPNCETCVKAASMKFREHVRQQELPVFIVADFESYLVEQEGGEGNTKKLQKHVPASYGYKVVVAEQYRHLACFQELVSYATVIKTADDLDNDVAVGSGSVT